MDIKKHISNFKIVTKNLLVLTLSKLEPNKLSNVKWKPIKCQLDVKLN